MIVLYYLLCLADVRRQCNASGKMADEKTNRRNKKAKEKMAEVWFGIKTDPRVYLRRDSAVLCGYASDASGRGRSAGDDDRRGGREMDFI